MFCLTDSDPFTLTTMSSEDIYNTYLTFARKSDIILKQYTEYANLAHSKVPKLELTYLHRNIKFIFKKLIGLLSNKKVWNRFSKPCSPHAYKTDSVNEFGVSCEVEFLIENREEIIEQLSCIINPTVFETDLKFLDTCYQKLEKAFFKIKDKASEMNFTEHPAYSIAS